MNPISIKITSTPEGEAPKRVRDKWIGLELDGVAYESGMLIGPGPDRLSGFVTFIKRALSGLKEHNPKAFEWWSKWWKERPKSEVFFFNRECYEVIDNVRRNQKFLDAFRGKPLEELVDYMMKH